MNFEAERILPAVLFELINYSQGPVKYEILLTPQLCHPYRVQCDLVLLFQSAENHRIFPSFFRKQWSISLEFGLTPSGLFSFRLTFELSTLESLRDVRVTRIGDVFPTVFRRLFWQMMFQAWHNSSSENSLPRLYVAKRDCSFGILDKSIPLNV